MKKFNEIKSRNDLADYLKIPHHVLTNVLYNRGVDTFYSVFEIPKKNGGKRKIAAPSGALKDIQTKLADALWNYQSEKRKEIGLQTNISHAFEKEKSIITNARIHRNKRFVLNIDLKDFFDSFHFGRVQGFFEKNRDYLFPHGVSVVIAQLTCFEGRLPQGAPTSPIITNLICQVLDMHILKMAKEYRLDYTRYADDLTFSTNWAGFLDVKDKFINELKYVITKAGFTINDEKTRLLFKDSRQEVTGLVVNKKVSVNRDYVRQTQAMAHSLYTTGEFTIDGMVGSINQLEGRFAFIDQLDHYNNRVDGAKHSAFYLCRREKEYRKFLFYKYFFANKNPVIITEGKTDVKYLEAALKNQYLRYPRLIEKTEEGFKFRVSFFHRTKHFKYFFNMSADGADAVKKLYCYFTGKDGCENYYKYLTEKCGCVQKAPIVLLFDNETESDKPLKKFLNDNLKESLGDKKALQDNLYLCLKKDSKLYILTNPLIEGKTECEIEDMFTNDTLSLELGGKRFCRNGSFDTEKYYGKDIFSTYILSHYNSINFSGFIPLLDALNAIVEDVHGSNQSCDAATEGVMAVSGIE